MTEVPAMDVMAASALQAGAQRVVMQRVGRRRSGCNIAWRQAVTVGTGCSGRRMVVVDRYPGAGAVTDNTVRASTDDTSVDGVGRWPAGCRTTNGMAAFAVTQYRHMVYPTHIIPG